MSARTPAAGSAPPTEERLLVVQMHGEPGSGKSTLARALGPAVGAIVLDKDLVKSALLRAGVEERLAGPASYEAFYAVAAALLQQGCSLILDNPVYWTTVQERSLRRAIDAGAEYVFIECVCPDGVELTRRLASRDAMPSQPRVRLSLGEHAGAIEASYRPRLTLDSTRPLAELVREAAAYVNASVDRTGHPRARAADQPDPAPHLPPLTSRGARR